MQPEPAQPDEAWAGSRAWPKAGFQRFLAGPLDDDFRRIYTDMAEARRPVVVLYGPSQVGKTELVLRLLGLRLSGKEAADVRDALRGEEAPGMPATSTAMIYRIWDDDGFGLGVHGGEAEKLSLSDLGSRLRRLRAAVEAGEVAGADRVELWLPQRLLTGSVATKRAVELVIDLPGVRSVKEREHAHVSSLVQHFLPIASRVVYVRPADQLAQLANDEDARAVGLRDCPDRVLVVLTYAAAGDSFRSHMRDTGFASPEVVEEYFWSLMGDLRVLRGRLALFPLDLGESWKTRLLDLPALRDQLAVVFDETLLALSSAFPVATEDEVYVAMARAHTVVAAQIAGALRAHDVEIASSRKAIAQQRRVLKRVTARSAANRLSAADARRRIADVCDIPAPRRLAPTPSDSDAATPETFRLYLDDSASAARHWASSVKDDSRARGIDCSFNSGELEALIVTSLSVTYDRLERVSDILWSKYTFSSTRAADRLAVRQAVGVLFGAMEERLKALHAAAVARVVAEAEDVAKHHEAVVSASGAQIAGLVRAAGTSEARLTDLLARRTAYAASSRASLEWARAFNDAMAVALDDYCRAEQRRVEDPTRRPEARVVSALCLLSAVRRARALGVLPPGARHE